MPEENLKPITDETEFFEENTPETVPEKKKKKLSKKKKKRIIIAVIVIILVAAIIAAAVLIPKNMKKASESYEYIRTTTLMKTSISESVTVTGTVSSGYDANVSVSDSAKQYKVLTIDVAVGDTVKEGDVIATLDTEDLLESIEKAQENYNDNVKSAQTSYNRAVSNYEKAVEQHEDNLDTYEDEIDTAYDAYVTARENKSSATSNLKSAEDAFDAVEKSYNEAVDKIKEYQSTYEKAKTEYEVAKADMYTDAAEHTENYSYNERGNEIIGGNSDYWNAYQNKKISLESTEKELELAKTGCVGTGTDGYSVYGFDSIESAYNSAKQNVERAEQTLTSAENSYNNAVKSYNNAVDKYESEEESTSLENSKQQVEDALDKLESAKSNTDNLDNLNDTLDDCTLKATIDGTVVALNATVGSPCNGTVATIQDLDSLVIDVTVSSNDVSNISTGMECIITSDATENEINGVLSQINPVANNSGSFSATVKVTDENSGLLVGIQAQVEIIISSTDDVFSVPIDAVGTEEDGTRYVLRKTGGSGTDMTFEHVSVTVGESNDYYIEINSDELNIGDVIRSSSDLSEGIVSSDEDDEQSMFDGFNFPGMNGGDMPSGDFGGGGGGDFSGGGSFTPPSGGGGGGGFPGGN